jgi:hypothetical protein
MMRRFAPALLALTFVAGCAGPAKLAEKSEHRLAVGDHWQAWRLATRALDQAPANSRARSAATAAATSIAEDWQRRIRAVAEGDSLAAANQVLEFASFRTDAAKYTTVVVTPDWAGEERVLRQTAARAHYQRGLAATAARRPKSACAEFAEVERFAPGYRDAATRSEQAFARALVRVAFVPFACAAGEASLGRELAASWHDELAGRVLPPDARFTRILDSHAVEDAMSVSQLGRTSREQAVRLGREAGAERVVWGSIGPVRAETSLHLFRDTIVRRVVEKGSDGKEVVHWVEAPIEVVARVRNVTAQLDYEIVATRGGATVAHQRVERTTSARVVWTSFVPEGEIAAYRLVSDPVREADPGRAREVETRWRSACGEQTTLGQVLAARLGAGRATRYDRTMLPRLIAGTAVVFLEDLPPPGDLAYAALAAGWQPLRDDLLRLDPIDDVDLGLSVATDEGH